MRLDVHEAQSLDTDDASTSHGDANGSLSVNHLNGSFSIPKVPCSRISCLNPWQWSQQHLSSSGSCFWHPLRHAAMVAIEYAAARDRNLFPTMGEADEKSVQLDPNAPSAAGLPANRQKINLANVSYCVLLPRNSENAFGATLRVLHAWHELDCVLNDCCIYVTDKL